jgi:hypothetical protein
MTDTPPPDGGSSEPEPPNAQAAWREVGHEFETLGSTIATAFRSAREQSAHREQLAEVQSGLQSMIDQVRRAVDDAAASIEGQQVRADAARAAESVRDATETTLQEIRPYLLDALRRVNDELSRVNRRLSGEDPDR